MASTTFQTKFPAPYLVYLGDVEDGDCCKTGYGLAEWAPERTLGQFRSGPDTHSVGLSDMSIEASVEAGAKSLVIGIAGLGGYLSESWYPDLLHAVEMGLNIVSGAHHKLAAVPGLADAAKRSGVQLVEVRDHTASYAIATGVKRSGKRLLTVGTDCALGKKFTALTLARQMSARGQAVDFRATGQTGIMISGGGIPIDSVVVDFVAGAAEALSPAAPDDHWDVIEGQGSLIHPGYAAVTLGLLHGSQPDEIVLCHDPRRRVNLDSPQVKIPPLPEVIELYLSAGRLTSTAISCHAISLNTRGMAQHEREQALADARAETGLIVFDPAATGVEELVDHLASKC